MSTSLTRVSQGVYSCKEPGGWIPRPHNGPGNNVGGQVGNYVGVKPVQLGNYSGADTSRPLSADDIDLALDDAGDLAQLLQEAERETRARLYRTLDLVLNLDPVGDPPTLDVRLQLCGGGGGI